tara:strand:+ start:159 stop:803 length:645 start_codon:yes stop_codon:yes gene_type:complete
LAKRLTEKQKEEIIKSFTCGKTIEFLSVEFSCTKSTIIRNLKRNLGELSYKEFIIKNKKSKENTINEINTTINNNSEIKKSIDKRNEEDSFPVSPFMEIIPLDYEIENSPRKELSSVPISDIEFPKMVYMIVDKKIELEIKQLKDYPNWNFLPIKDLNRKTIEIYFDLKIAKRFCNKEQKVIKVPNTDVFRIVSPLLISRGISRIVSSDKLIAL